MRVDHDPTCVEGISERPRALLKLSSITSLMQPIVELSSGRVVGFEALARLQDGNLLLAPDQFLPELSDEERVWLFREMLRQAHDFVTAARRRRPDLIISVNVETSIVMRDDLPELIEMTLGAEASTKGIYLELLESEKILDLKKAMVNLTRLKKMAIGLSLDDVGSAYSSLIMLKRLPIDVIKLDQAFARELARKPSDLQFVQSVMSLSRGLRKKLVVEGVETLEILDALTVLGVDYVQGFTIAKPMPAIRALEWLDEAREKKRSRIPNSLLGCYSAHLLVVETCRIIDDQSLPMRWDRHAKDPHACGIGIYLNQRGLHDTSFGVAHKAFHDVIDRYGSDREIWETAAELFRRELEHAILAGTAEQKSGSVVPLRLIPVCSCVTFTESATRPDTQTMKKTEPSRFAPAFPTSLFAQLAEATNDVIIVTTPDMELPGPRIVYVNPAFTRLTGYTADEAIGRSPRMLQRSGTDRVTLDAIKRRLLAGLEVHEKLLNYAKGGERYWLDLRIVPLRDEVGKITHFAAIERDVTMDKRRLDELEMVADRDGLTGIPNRRALLRVIESEIAALRSRSIARPYGRDACLAFFDVDHFKSVNDAHGHGVGDAVLLGIADRLTENLRRSDALGRMGGEEFALWMPGVTLRDAQELVDRLRRIVSEQPFETPSGPVTVSVSIGVTAFQPIDNLVHLMNRADKAMYSAKKAGRNRVVALEGT